MWPGLGLQSLCNVDWYVLWNVRYCPLILSNTVGRESMFAAIPFARMTCGQLVLVWGHSGWRNVALHLLLRYVQL